MDDPYPLYKSLLRCANCRGELRFADGEEVVISCVSCAASYFTLGETTCIFPNAMYQKVLWQHQLGLMVDAGRRGLDTLHESASRYDLSDYTRARVQEHIAAVSLSQDSTVSLMKEVGIEPHIHDSLKGMQAPDLAEYWELMLRDWVWDRCSNSNYAADENREALERVLSVNDQADPQVVLVIGAGSGRLSWDVHCALKPASTIALDTNPVMLAVADRLIKQQKSVKFGEIKIWPQMEPRSSVAFWDVPPAHDPESLRHQWHALAADGWNIPLQEKSCDLIITPWYIDVNGGDVRDTIAVVSRFLKPGGLWINTGPLLFSREIPIQLKYQPTEIKEFLQLSGFELISERFDQIRHLAAELDVRERLEKLWTFSARLASDNAGQLVPGVKAPWLVMHHLPIPAGLLRPPQEHPVMELIFSRIDGLRSINDISAEIAPELPAGFTPTDLVVTILGQALEQA